MNFCPFPAFPRIGNGSAGLNYTEDPFKGSGWINFIMNSPLFNDRLYFCAMQAEIICIGDELLIGQVINTNAAKMAQLLQSAGLAVGRISDIGDDPVQIRQALDEALSRSDIVLLTGGLGPTRDDLTRQALCDYFRTSLVFHEPSFRNVERFFLARGLKVTGRNREQAMVPASCTPLLNLQGTAPGMWFEDKGKIVVAMPGVPYEMESMMTGEVIPRLKAKGFGEALLQKTILTTGLGESFLADRIRHWEESLPGNMKLAYLPQPGIVRLRLTASNGQSSANPVMQTADGLQAMLDKKIRELTGLIPDLVFGYDEDTLEEVVGKLLLSKGATLGTAESCTGGYIASLITSVPGASNYFRGSVIAYDNEVKQNLLGVKRGTLEQHGAVSEEVVLEMAVGAKDRLKVDYAIAVSGIAGPDGGTPGKPVGTVWIAVAGKGHAEARHFIFGDHRQRNIRRSAIAALNMLRLFMIS